MTRCFAPLLALLCIACSRPAPETLRPARYIYTADRMADPSAHVFDGVLYIYPSHDRISEVTDPADGAHFDMADYHVLRMDDPEKGEAVDLGTVLTLEQVPWASKQLWAPDAARKGDRYLLYFPAKDSAGIFRIGAAVADRPEGPFTAQPEPMEGTYSIDPCVFEDGGELYLYFGGLQGGQLQRWQDNRLLDEERMPAAGEPALAPRVARLSADGLSLAEASRPVETLDAEGNPLAADDPHRFFEAPWLHKHDGLYYFVYSTGTTHLLCYATGTNPYGPFTFRGELMSPVEGWTTHPSTVEYAGRWWLFHHDSALSGHSSLRNLKVAEFRHLDDGTLTPLDGRPERTDGTI